jgi:hypothetical protein
MGSREAKNPAPSAYAHAASIVITLLFVATCFWLFIQFGGPSTPESKKAAAERTELCYQADFCDAYGETRQACATAGDFANCIRVKIGDKNLGRLGYCANDGGLASPPQDMPSSFECFRHRWGL